MITTGTFSNDDNTKRITIDYDDEPMNPRIEQDNVGTLWCEHRRYVLGDKDAKDTLREAIEALTVDTDIDLEAAYLPCPECNDIPRSDWVYEVTNDQTNLSYEAWMEHNLESCELCDEDQDIRNPNFNEMLTSEEILEALELVDPDEEHIFRLPLFLYDHGGITISTTPFSCQWDSGQVGMTFVSKERAVGELWMGITPDMTTEQIRDLAHKGLRAEVETYDQYLRGDIYFFSIEELNEGEWEHVDSLHNIDSGEVILYYVPQEHREWVEAAL